MIKFIATIAIALSSLTAQAQSFPEDIGNFTSAAIRVHNVEQANYVPKHFGGTLWVKTSLNIQSGKADYQKLCDLAKLNFVPLREIHDVSDPSGTNSMMVPYEKIKRLINDPDREQFAVHICR